MAVAIASVRVGAIAVFVHVPIPIVAVAVASVSAIAADVGLVAFILPVLALVVSCGVGVVVSGSCFAGRQKDQLTIQKLQGEN